MGSVFRYVADAALAPTAPGPCQHCERPGVPAFPYRGRVLDPALAADPVLAAEEPAIEEACAACIHGGNLRKTEAEVRQMEPLARAHASAPAEALARYHRIPHLPLLLQHDDWPLCCGDWAVYVGVPASEAEAERVPDTHRFWDRGPAGLTLRGPLRPESLREVALFRCPTCGGRLFLWQPT